MSFRGLDFGSGLSHYGDLLAKGFQDQQELSRQQQLMEYQRQTAAQNAQRAGLEYGYLADNPEEFQRQGGSMVPRSDVSSLIGAAPTTPIQGPGPASVAQVTPPAPSADVDANAAKNQAYQQALQQIGTTNPSLVNAQTGFVHPYADKVARDIAEKKAAIDEKLQVAKIMGETRLGAADRYADSRRDVADSQAGARVQTANIAALMRQRNQLTGMKDGLGRPVPPDPQALVRIDAQLSALSGADTEAPPTAPPAGKGKRPDGKYYSPSQNKTYTYSGGVAVKVEDGHT